MVELWSFFLTDDSLLSCFLQCNIISCVFREKHFKSWFFKKTQQEKEVQSLRGGGGGEKLPTKDKKDAKGTCNLLIPIKIIQKMKTYPEMNMKDWNRG